MKAISGFAPQSNPSLVIILDSTNGNLDEQVKAGQVSQKRGNPLGDAEDSMVSPESSVSLCLGFLQQKADYAPKLLRLFGVHLRPMHSHAGTGMRFLSLSV